MTILKQICCPKLVTRVQLIVAKTAIPVRLSPQDIHGRRPTAAIVAYSLAGVHTLRGRPDLTSPVAVKFPVSGSRCPNN